MLKKSEIKVQNSNRSQIKTKANINNNVYKLNMQASRHAMYILSRGEFEINIIKLIYISRSQI